MINYAHVCTVNTAASQRSLQHKSDIHVTGSMSLVQCKSAMELAWQKNHQAQVVQKVDNAIHQMNHYPADNLVCFVTTYVTVHRMAIYPVDSVILSSLSSLLTTWVRPMIFDSLSSHNYE